MIYAEGVGDGLDRCEDGKPRQEEERGRAVRKQPELMKTRYDRFCKIPNERRKRCTSSSQLDKRRRKKKSRLSKRFSIKVWLTRGAHACGGEESSLDDVLEGLQWLDACVRVQVRTGRLWLRPGPCGGVFLGLRLVQLNC